ncbi:MAG: hypothetical protein ACLU5J_05610 [Christensenellales bacterium]
MDNFEVLNHYSIPSDILMDMLSTYKLLGKSDAYKNQLLEQESYIQNEVLEKDTFYAIKLLKIDNISDNRLRLLIAKNSLPKNKQEEVVIGLKKKVFVRLHYNAKRHLSFNGSDLLDYLNTIFGKKSTTFSKDVLTKNDRKVKPISIRLSFERVLENYHLYRLENKFEPIFLSVITFMEMINLQPYSNNNEIASVLSLYYMMLLSEVYAFEYISFMELYFTFRKDIEEAVAKGSLNYFTNYLQTSDTVRLVFKLIGEAYNQLDGLIKNLYFAKRAYKSDVIEETIYKKMPKYFTKDDIRRFHPDASDSTINRILFKLRDEQIIMPLGKGRKC